MLDRLRSNRTFMELKLEMRARQAEWLKAF